MDAIDPLPPSASPTTALPHWYVVRAATPGPELQAAIALSSRAAGNEERVRADCHRGEVFVLSDPAAEPGDEPLGVAVVVSEQGPILCRLDTGAAPDGSALAVRLLEGVSDILRRRGVQRLHVRTGSLRGDVVL